MSKIVESIQERRIQVKLSIADQRPENRIAESRRKWSITGMLFLRALCILRALFLQQPVLLHFMPRFFCYIFLFLPILTLVIAFVLFFLVISYTLSTDISLSLYKLTSLHIGNRETGLQFHGCFLLFPFSFIFFPLSRLPNTPLRMKTERMVG